MTGSGSTLAERLLDVIEFEIVPRTRAGVAIGNKVFGAAILDKCDLSLVIAETNNELENPLWHGEVYTLKRFYEIAAELRPATKDCIFLSTHEPCSLCLSAITWSGFDNFYYLFGYTATAESFSIPHDLRILQEVFRISGGSYRRSNHYWKCHSITELIEEFKPARHRVARKRIADLELTYRELSDTYQASKADTDIPLP